MPEIYADPLVTLYQDDCLTVLPQLSDAFDLCLTDPPWNISAEEDVVIGGRDNHTWQRTGWEWDKMCDDDYWRFTSQWLVACDRLLRPGGHLIIWADVWKLGQLSSLLSDKGYTKRQALYWVSTHPAPRMRKVDFMSAVQAAGWWVKAGDGAVFNHLLGQTPNYWTVSLGSERVHPTQKPVQVLATLIRYLTNPGDLVLDPFAGSGSTLAAAKAMGRRSVGIEIDLEFCNTAVGRIKSVSYPMAMGVG